MAHPKHHRQQPAEALPEAVQELRGLIREAHEAAADLGRGRTAFRTEMAKAWKELEEYHSELNQALVDHGHAISQEAADAVRGYKESILAFHQAAQAEVQKVYDDLNGLFARVLSGKTPPELQQEVLGLIADRLLESVLPRVDELLEPIVHELVEKKFGRMKIAHIDANEAEVMTAGLQRLAEQGRAIDVRPVRVPKDRKKP